MLAMIELAPVWLDQEQVVYLDAYASITHPDLAVDEAEWLVRRANYIETTRMQINMLGYLATKDPNCLNYQVSKMMSLLATTNSV